jgi:hypothetical protein
MSRVFGFALVLLVAVSAAKSSFADLAKFTNFNLSGPTVGWDTFTGTTYQGAYSYTVAGLKLDIVNPGHLNGPMNRGVQMTGPLAPTGDMFYTFNAAKVNFSITGTALTGINRLVLQGQLAPGGLSDMTNISLSNSAATSTGTNADGVKFWSWDNLAINPGEQFTFTWETGMHTALDAFQVQSNVAAVPEPTSMLLMGAAGVGGLLLKRRRKVSQPS